MLKCGECGGRVINGNRGFYVCEGCGLEHDQVLVAPTEKNNPYHDQMEDIYRKERRERKMMSIVRKKENEKAGYQLIQVWKEVYMKLKEYIDKYNLIQRDFVSKIIMSAIEEN